MTRTVKRLAGVAAALITTAGLAACGGSSSSPSAAASSSAKPVSGGTLRIVAASGPQHLDTVPAYSTTSYQLEHAYARQLLSYPTLPYTSTSGPNWVKDITPTADIATEVPTVANGGVTNGGKTYTFHIKQGVDWNTTPPRQVTAQDFLREFKAFFNPVSPVGNPVYYESTIAGLTQYANAETAYFANAKAHPPTAANIARFQQAHGISGIATPTPATIRFTLTQPASDFLYMMAMPFTSARPPEYDGYVPNSLQLNQHTISDGPYQISSYVPGKSITLVRDPAWKQSTDPLRHDYVSEVVDTLGTSSTQTQLAELQAGSEDIISDTPLNPSSIPSLEASHDANFAVFPWSTTAPYIVFNLRSPDSGGAMDKLLVRQAVEYGLDKQAVLKAYGGPAVGSIINGVIPPGNVGYQNYNRYPDDNGQGNAAMCKTDLAKAGYPNGLSLGPEPECAEEPPYRFFRDRGHSSGAGTTEVHVQLAIREVRRDLTGEVHRQGGLADPGGPADHHGRSRLADGDPGQCGEHAKLSRPAGEARRPAGQLPRDRRNKERPAALRGPGQARLRLGRRDQQRLLRRGEPERAGQLSQRPQERPAGPAALHVTDRTDAEAGSLSEFLLGQPRANPVAAQQRTKLRVPYHAVHDVPCSAISRYARFPHHGFRTGCLPRILFPSPYARCAILSEARPCSRAHLGSVQELFHHGHEKPMTEAEREKLLIDGDTARGMVVSSEPSAADNRISQVRLRVRFKDGQTVEFGAELPNLYQPAPGSPEARRLAEVREAEQLRHPGRIPKIQLPLSGGEMIPVRYDAADRSKMVIDVPALQKRALHDYIKREQRPKGQSPDRQGAGSGPPWVVPAHCPNCGAPVDQATASRDRDPHCEFCDQPVPVQGVR